MTSRRRNFLIILLLLGLLGASLAAIARQPTRLGLDLRGGVELVYEGRPTPRVPQVTPQAIEDAISTIRKRTDNLGVSEPEIQPAGANQISIALPDVEDADRAVEQVGTTAQLQFYDWEPNVEVAGGRLDRPYPTLFEAVTKAAAAKPQAEREDVPPGVRAGRADYERYDRQNDSTQDDRYYLFGRDRKLLSGPDSSCEELAADYESAGQAAAPGGARSPAAKGECAAELSALGQAAPPAGARVLKVPRGIVVVQDERPRGLPANAPFDRHWLLEDDTSLSGNDITDPKQTFDPQDSQPVVSFSFTDEGERAFEEVTRRIAQRGSEQILPPGASAQDASQRFAITLDNQIVSLASVNFREYPEGIEGSNGAQIDGIGNIEDTQALADNLRIGALPIELKLVSQTKVSATLGAQALRQGLIAAGAGLALTLLFLIGFYRVLGVVASVTLMIYAVLLYAIVELIPITLTLPGIAGLILTLGVAADANIVVFERIKEEARTGRSIPAAIAAGYGKALRTILDANVVTFGVAFILFLVATAGVKGFAFTLGIGTLVSLFTAVLATSAILGAMSRTRLLRSRLALGAGTERLRWNFDFMGASKWFFSFSGAILAAGAIAIAALGLNFGIDFESGTRLKTPLERPATVAQVRDTLAPLGLGDAKIQQVDEPELGANVVQISASVQPDEVQRVKTALDERFGIDEAEFTNNTIGPTFGAQIAYTAAIAIVASLFLISIYIGFRFQFKFAVPVLIALAHDLLITAGVYALFGREVTTSTVAALLTILGFSLYDTIIVFDRIRENVPRMPRATFSQIVNRSMSEVLTRSLATSFSTLIPVVALMAFGGETLRDFGFALLVGIASGTYSSIFIAAPVLTAWKEREPIYRRRRALVEREHAGVVPAFAPGRAGADDDDSSAPSRERERPARRVPVGTVTGGAATDPPASGPYRPSQPAAAPRPVRTNGAYSSEGTGASAASAEAEERERRKANRRRKRHGRR